MEAADAFPRSPRELDPGVFNGRHIDHPNDRTPRVVM